MHTETTNMLVYTNATFQKFCLRPLSFKNLFFRINLALQVIILTNILETVTKIIITLVW
jgi:hypothetical protein